MNAPRFYVNPLEGNDSVTLSREDAKHATTVLRLGIGAEIRLFDGCGTELIGRIQLCERDRVVVGALRMIDASPPPRNRLELLVALPKGDRQKVLVDMLVQLGASSLTPLNCERSVAQPTAQVVERLKRVVVESSKQCGRNHLMTIHPARTMDAMTMDASTMDEAPAIESQSPTEARIHLFAHPYGAARRLGGIFGSSSDSQPLVAQAIVGPEGGLTDAECELLRVRGWQQISCGEHILRVETAAVMIAAAWAAHRG
jgi:16S rRNA (uracil1498-N3)-methyltransferase